MWPDRTPHPAVWEYRYLAQPIKAVAFNANTGVLQIKNRQTFASAAWLRGSWELKVNGHAVAKGELPKLRAAAQQTESVRIKLPKLPLKPGEEAFLNLRFESAEKTAWCDAGYLVGWEQFLVAKKAEQTPRFKKLVAYRVEKSRGAITIANDEVVLGASIKEGPHR